ncbi:MAG: hypothetical protein H0X13_10350 [Ramlibacter sp.]|nr:hypothetical protein [Ramlibacter sp.]
MKATITFHRRTHTGSIGPVHHTVEANWPNVVPFPTLEEHADAERDISVASAGLFRLEGDKYMYQVCNVNYLYELKEGVVAVERAFIRAVAVDAATRLGLVSAK